MTTEQRAFKTKMLAYLRVKLTDGAERPPSLLAVYHRTVAKLEAELARMTDNIHPLMSAALRGFTTTPARLVALNALNHALTDYDGDAIDRAAIETLARHIVTDVRVWCDTLALVTGKEADYGTRLAIVVESMDDALTPDAWRVLSAFVALEVAR